MILINSYQNHLILYIKKKINALEITLKTPDVVAMSYRGAHYNPVL